MTASPATEERASIRDRYRIQVQDEVKQVALRQIAGGGPSAVSVNAIAKELGLSGPALYRYFPSRDALLTALVLDGYLDFAAELRAVATDTARRKLDPVDRVREVASAYRGWANAHPHQYRLLFREPVPGYDAHSEELVAAAQELMAVNVEVIDGLTAASAAAPGGERAFRAVIFWARIHGLVDLELNGNFRSMRLDPDVLYEYEMAQLVNGH